MSFFSKKLVILAAMFDRGLGGQALEWVLRMWHMVTANS